MGRAHVSSIAIASLLAALPACDGCHNGKPYTPYTLNDPPDASSSGSTVPPTPSADGGPAFTVVAATPAPGDGSRWPLDGGPVEAPPGHAFAQGLVVDADGDGKPDLLAWARAPDGLRGELWFASGKSPGEGRLIAALPADLTATGCTAQATLSLIGPRTVAFDFDPRCPARIRERATRWIALARFVAGPPEIALELRAGAPADGESIAVALEARDRDGDGRADIGVTFTLTGAPHPLPGGGSAAASLSFFDRPAGLSRDPIEPEASFKAIGTALMADGRKKTTSPRVPAAAGAARRLHALLCEDGGGKPIITTTAGPIRCATERIAEESAIAEVEAALNLGDPVSAFAALGRLDAVGQRRKDVDTLVAKSVPTIAGTLVRTTAAIPDPPRASGYSPLAFDADGSLLVRTAERVVRVDKGTFSESAADAVEAWPKELQWPIDAPTWSLGRVDDECEMSTAVARFGYAGAATTVPLPVPVPPRCVAGGASPPVDLLGASTQGILFAYRGEVVAIPAAAPPRVVVAESFAPAPGVPVDRGTARSPNGGTLAITTSRGVLVAVLKGSARGAHAKLWTSPLIDGAKACVPSDGGERLACVVSKGAAIYDVK